MLSSLLNNSRVRSSFRNFGFNVGGNRFGIQTAAGDNHSNLTFGMTRHVGTDGQLNREVTFTWLDEYAIYEKGMLLDDGSKEIRTMHGDEEVVHRLSAERVKAIATEENALISRQKKAHALKGQQIEARLAS